MKQTKALASNMRGVLYFIEHRCVVVSFEDSKECKVISVGGEIPTPENHLADAQCRATVLADSTASDPGISVGSFL